MEETAAGDLAKLEERFLADMERRPAPVDALLGTLRFLRTSGRKDLAESWAQTLQETLVAASDGAVLLRLLTLLNQWGGDKRAFGSHCLAVLKQAGKERLWLACIASVAFGEVAPSESLRRLDLLLALRPGAGCLDKTWGFGVVKSLDDFYKRIVVDFTTQPNHALTLAYAASTLTLADPEHLLALRHRDSAAVARLADANPGELVRLALRSFGPLSAARLETLLTDHKIVAASDWKRFWDGARKALKADPLVHLPGKRTEPLSLRAAAMEFDRAWFDKLRAERDTGAIMRMLADIEADPALGKLDEHGREVLSERLAFAVLGAFRSDAVLYARLALLTRRLGLESPPAAELRAHLWDEERYVRAGESLPARDCGQLVALLLDDSGAPARLLEALPRMSYNLLAETIEGLLPTAAAPALRVRCHELLAAAAVPSTLLVWILRNRDLSKEWNLPTIYELLAHAIAIIEDRTLGGEALRMQHQLRALYENARWFEAAFAAMDGIQQEAIFDRIYGNATLWDAATQRMLVGRMVALVPALADRKQAATSVTQSNVRWTSWRSLRERREQFERLVEIDIPSNSHDLAVARSHGDLRENFEFQAAKQQQGVLLGRRDQWDLDLQQMHGTNFEEADRGAVGMGVEVCFERAGGGRQRIAILGEWDRDEALDIVANRSGLAMALEGKRVGEQAMIPGLHGEERVTIVAIEPLSEAVRAWVGAPADAGNE